MPARETAPAGAPCWVDLSTSDPDRSREFYTRLFGWTIEDPVEEFGGYANFSSGDALVAGCMPAQPGTGMPDAWSVYLASDDADKTLALATAHGGTVHVGAMPVADLGTMAFLGDPSGGAVGVWQPGRHAGFGVVAEPGAPSWFELHSRDYAAAVAFYRDVFGWDTHVLSDTPEFRYTVQRHGDEWLAGVMDDDRGLPDGVPSHWSVYFGVADTDAALATVVDLGGSVVAPAQDSPYGRIAGVADPLGARFQVVAANAEMPARA